MNAEDSRIFADIVVETDCMGVESHGIARVPLYTGRIKSGVMSTGLKLEILRDYPWGVAADAHDKRARASNSLLAHQVRVTDHDIKREMSLQGDVGARIHGDDKRSRLEPPACQCA